MLTIWKFRKSIVVRTKCPRGPYAARGFDTLFKRKERPRRSP